MNALCKDKENNISKFMNKHIKKIINSYYFDLFFIHYIML